MLFCLKKKKKVSTGTKEAGRGDCGHQPPGLRTAGSHLPPAQRANFQPKHRSSRRIWWYTGKQQRPVAGHGQSKGPHRDLTGSLSTALFSLLLSELPTG